MLLLKEAAFPPVRVRRGPFPLSRESATPPSSSPTPPSRDNFDVLSPKEEDLKLEKLAFREDRCFRDERGTVTRSPSGVSDAEKASMLLKLLLR
jgi:hypothetical protein